MFLIGLLFGFLPVESPEIAAGPPAPHRARTPTLRVGWQGESRWRSFRGR